MLRPVDPDFYVIVHLYNQSHVVNCNCVTSLTWLNALNKFSHGIFLYSVHIFSCVEIVHIMTQFNLLKTLQG